MPASVRILMEAASAAVTVCFTDCIRFCAFPTSISVASMSSSVPVTDKIALEIDLGEISHPVLRASLPSLLRGFSAGSRWSGSAHTLEAGSEEKELYAMKSWFQSHKPFSSACQCTPWPAPWQAWSPRRKTLRWPSRWRSALSCCHCPPGGKKVMTQVERENSHLDQL